MKKFVLLFAVLVFCVLPTHGNTEIITQDFESGIFPPTGWIQVINNVNSVSWKSETDPNNSSNSVAGIWYDEDLELQNEWLLSPEITPMSGVFTVNALSFGSPSWGRDEYNNYDLNLWLVYNDVGGSDDIFVGKLDDNWTDEYTWSNSDFDLAQLFIVGAPVRVGFQYYGTDGADAALDNITIQWKGGTPVPEPTTLLLLGLGLVGIAGVRRKFRN